MNHNIKTIEKKLNKLEKDLLETKELLNQTKQTALHQGTFHVFSYFNHSLKLSKNTGNPNLYIFGSFLIRNIGEQNLNRPYICLKMNHTKNISFSGKISPEDLLDRAFSPLPMQTWYYIDEKAELLAHKKGEYWLQPLQFQQLPAGQSLSFANFMIRLDQTKLDSTFKVEGAVFGDELEEGLPALNKIQVNIS
ncbi:hypothetical protein GLV98_13930 [Halobacillus litoralis]|uniref:Uncharacterized protein n=1 Tax=Halobacillus litoralis TaxID=45668 RepID=A0A845E7D9_9BACI|nr:hypothetical protein [Halobacillus litoralis]MYL50593.1 hypothetical protein [Halobacillus litoralis]